MRLTSKKIRQLFLNDDEWERTSKSWKSLIPSRKFNEFDLSDESEEEYCERLKPRFDIPLNIAKQWLYPLYYDRNSTNNYGWMDYDEIEFQERELNFNVLSNVNIINEHKHHIDEGSIYQAYDKLPCTDRDREYWINNSTWRIPPIILDVTSLVTEEIPNYSEIKPPFQLVEGHSRLGYLFAANNCDVLKKRNHRVYIMKYKNV